MADSAVLPAVTGVVGAGIGAILSQVRWAKDRAAHRRSPFEAKRRDAYDGLWRVVEQAHVVARMEVERSPEVERQLLAEVNSFALVNSVYLDDSDREIAAMYISGVLKLLAGIEKADRPEYRQMAANTASFPPDFGSDLRDLSRTAEANEQIRSLLLAKVRAVMKGDDEDPPEPT